MSGLTSQKRLQPFLRWAGGKSWLIKHLCIGDIEYKNYHEPFLGGGAVFFALKPVKQAYLSDINPDLINTYKAIKTDPAAVINALKTFENTSDFYYRIRQNTYSNSYESAARFIYLNQTSFNGLYRVNRDGIYNVPYGYRTKSFLEEEKILQASACLQKTIINCESFTGCMNRINANDLVFLDPPYTVSHNNNGFIKYNQKLFTIDDQKRLSGVIDHIKGQGAFYILTNAAHPTIHDIFDKGDNLIELNRASLIGGENAKRGQTQEYIFTNIPRRMFR